MLMKTKSKKRYMVRAQLLLLLLFGNLSVANAENRQMKGEGGVRVNYLEKLENESKRLMQAGKRKEALEALVAAEKHAVEDRERQRLSGKRRLYAEQFLRTDSFEKYQAAKVAAGSLNGGECLSEIEKIEKGDQDNIQTIVLKGHCYSLLDKKVEAERLFELALETVPNYTDAALEYSELLLGQKKLPKIGALLSGVRPNTIRDENRLIVLKSRHLEAQGKSKEAAEYLKKEYNGAIDRSQVLLELGELYFRISEEGSIESAWQARKYLTLFQKRCQSSAEIEMALKPSNRECTQIEVLVGKLDKKLNQTPK